MIAYSIAFLLFGSLSYLYVKDSKKVVRFKEEQGLSKEPTFDLRFKTSQILGRWGTKIGNIEVHKMSVKMSNPAIDCEVKTKQSVIWKGDLDLTSDKDKLEKLSKEIDKTVYVEVDGRVVFETSNGHTEVFTVDVDNEVVKNRNDRLDDFFNKHK
ncbi:MAG: hypothetical protein SLAVMIC_00753 [uncultured marine phage]|uniref:Uncharacterized protein n=1 Tax=uncultured marine phage TaxID=707152 RepID=A0A8D9C9H1_9VIRU|nr:MAG: hypothetical protein SLAVMIC_00753 [uncultured marine phage]